MRSDTQSVTINAPPKAVLAFVGLGENLPRWAIGFAKEVHRDQHRWIVTTGQGAVLVSIGVDEASGTVDFRMEPGPGAEAIAYAQGMPNGSGAEFVFTQFQQPGTPDDVFDQLVATVAHELIALKALVEVECPL